MINYLKIKDCQRLQQSCSKQHFDLQNPVESKFYILFGLTENKILNVSYHATIKNAIMIKCIQSFNLLKLQRI